AEPGSFGQTFQGVTIGVPLAAALPPGLYASMYSVVAPTASGVGQDLGKTGAGFIWAPGLLWSTGYRFLGADISAAVVQPFHEIVIHPSSGSSLANNGSGPPYGNAVLFSDIHNTIFVPFSASWKLGYGWFASVSFGLIAPDGSTYNGTANPDYWTYQPR